ncbi:MAG: polysaccharide biosynthesis C-terminal domain-containing protein [Candidatus Krumholzibacteria bacterium]|nr:polysaccharide biosynthesis C-terminal domain-containing protein [Candidatus Krumholzibacteria bacterium]
MEKKKLYKSGFFVALVSFLSKGLGYLREIILAYFFGTGAVVDGFRIAVTAIMLPVNILAGAGLQNSFIPVFRGHLSTGRKRIAWALANQLFFFLMIAGLVIFVLEYFFAEKWIYLLAPGFNSVQTGHAVFFTKIMSFSVPMLMACATAYVLNCFYIFKTPSLRPVVQNIFVLAGVLLTVYRNDFAFMGAAFPVAYVVFFLMLTSSLRKYWHFQPIKSLRRAMKIWSTFLPVWLPLMGMVLVAQLNVYIDRVITSLLAEGSVAALEYSRFLVETPGITLGMGFMSVFLPYFSDLSARDEMNRLSTDIGDMIMYAVYIMLPISVVLFVGAEEVIRLIYGYGKFGNASIELTAGALRGYSIGVWAYFLYIPISKYYQAVKRNVLLLVCFVISLALNITLNLMLYKRFGISGIAVATSISQIVLFVLLFVFMKVPEKGRAAGRILFMTAVALVSGLVAWWTGSVLSRSSLFIEKFQSSVDGSVSRYGYTIRLFVILVVIAVLWFVLTLALRKVREEVRKRLRRGGGRGSGTDTGGGTTTDSGDRS